MCPVRRCWMNGSINKPFLTPETLKQKLLPKPSNRSQWPVSFLKENRIFVYQIHMYLGKLFGSRYWTWNIQCVSQQLERWLNALLTGENRIVHQTRARDCSQRRCDEWPNWKQRDRSSPKQSMGCSDTATLYSNAYEWARAPPTPPNLTKLQEQNKVRHKR